MSSGQRNFYEILNADPEATYDELKRNYKQLILQCHPDKLRDKSPTSADAGSAAAALDIDPNDDKFIEINEAWNTLKDNVLRKLYDAELVLMKFQAHNNIYARLQFSDMVRQQIPNDDEDSATDTTTTTADNSTSTSDGANRRDATTKGGGPQEATPGGSGECVQQTGRIIYTYACRCGGQYIVDESADNKIFGRNDSNDDGDDNDDADNDSDADIDCGEVLVECSECSLVIILFE